MTKSSRQTSFIISPQTDAKLRALRRAGHSRTLTGIVELAIDRMYQDELFHGRVDHIPEVKKGWTTLPDK